MRADCLDRSDLKARSVRVVVMIIMGVLGNISMYSAVYLEIGLGRALVHEKKSIRLGILWMAIRSEEKLDAGEHDFGWRTQMLGA